MNTTCLVYLTVLACATVGALAQQIPAPQPNFYHCADCPGFGPGIGDPNASLLCPPPDFMVDVKCDVFSFYVDYSDAGIWIPIGSRLVLVCDTCGSCHSERCVARVTTTQTETVSVSGTSGASTDIRAEINTSLALNVGIGTTTEFQLGLADSSTVTTQVEVECGNEEYPECSRTEYRVDRRRRSVYARAIMNWHRLYRCSSFDPGTWALLDPAGPCSTTTATLRGFEVNEYACIAVDQPCSPPQPTCCQH